jgi:hypothetical protein
VTDKQLPHVVYGVCFALLALTAAQALGRGRATISAAPEQPCRGEPIFVDYPYQDSYFGPHTCRVQCDDQRQRFIAYSDGKATQCQDLPGCLDWGEDRRITCTPPAQSVLGGG